MSEFRLPAVIADTAILNLARYLFNIGLEVRKPFLIVGTQGVGKSTAMQVIARENDRILYIRCGKRNERLTVFFNLVIDEIWKKFGPIHLPARATQQQRFEAIIEAITQYGIIAIFVDETQTLNWDVIRELMDVGEEAEMTIGFIGNPTVLKRTGYRISDAINQLRSRVAGRVMDIERFSTDDLTKIAKSLGVDGEAELAYLDKFTKLEAENDLRAVDALIAAARKLAGGNAIVRLNHLRDAFRLGFPRQDERSLFKLVPKPRKEENAA